MEVKIDLIRHLIRDNNNSSYWNKFGVGFTLKQSEIVSKFHFTDYKEIANNTLY